MRGIHTRYGWQIELTRDGGTKRKGRPRRPDQIVKNVVVAVLSGQFEPVSARTVKLILIPDRDRATQPERRHD